MVRFLKNKSTCNQKQVAGDNSVQIQSQRDTNLYLYPEENLLKTTLKKVCKKQLSAFILKDTEILEKKAKRLACLYDERHSVCDQNDFFRKLSNGFAGFDQPLHRSQEEQDVSVLKNYCENNNCEIIISTCTWFVGVATILSYMRSVLNIPLKIDFNFSHSGKTAFNLKLNTNTIIPHISIIADGPSSFLFENYHKEPKYLPASFAPPCEHKIVLHKESSKWKNWHD